tara:strand:- start:1257 stop:2117 length:861 start_codon:yes stop_codon:yes gene_type:complete
MALRKDKIQALKDSLCLDNVDPSTRSALNNLVDNLIPLFEATALPELEGINTGQDELPVEEEPEMPIGEGEPLFFDPLDGFEDAPPGGGDDQGGGDEGEGDPCENAQLTHVTFLAKTLDEIPAAENGNPGIGKVEELVVVQADLADRNKCKEECNERHKEDLKHAREMLDDAKTSATFDPITILDAETGVFKKVDIRDEAVQHWVNRLSEIEQEYQDCVINCDDKPDADGPKKTGAVFIAQNISCEKIEKDTTVVVSGTVVSPRELAECGEDNLFITVEVCGCCDE